MAIELEPFAVEFCGQPAGEAVYQMTEDGAWAAVWGRPDGYWQMVMGDTLEQASRRLTEAIDDVSGEVELRLNFRLKHDWIEGK